MHAELIGLTAHHAKSWADDAEAKASTYRGADDPALTHAVRNARHAAASAAHVAHVTEVLEGQADGPMDASVVMPLLAAAQSAEAAARGAFDQVEVLTARV